MKNQYVYLSLIRSATVQVSIITEDSDRAKQGFVGRKKYPDQYSINFNQICCILSWFEGFENLSPAFTFVVTAAQNFSTLIKVAWI